jgi:hypothetical protein
MARCLIDSIEIRNFMYNPIEVKSFAMKRLSKVSVLSVVVLVLFGWLMNGGGVYSAAEPEMFNNQNTRDVIYSDWISVDQWVTTTALGHQARAFEINNPLFSDKDLDSGQLLVYTQFDTPGAIQLLPTTTQNENNQYRFDYLMSSSATLRILSINLQGDFTPAQPQKFRYLFVPTDLINKINVDLANYEAVKQALALPE